MTRGEVALTIVMVLVVAGTGALLYELGFQHGNANGRTVEALRWQEHARLCDRALAFGNHCDPPVRYIEWCPVWMALGCDDPLDPHCGEDRE